MITAKFDPQQFFQRGDAVSLLVPASEVFGLLKRSLDLPSAWGALLIRQGGELEFVPPGGRVQGDGTEQVLFARTTPVELEFQEDHLPTSDGFQCSVQVRLRIRPIPERTELVSFRRSIHGSHRAVITSSLSKYLQPALREAFVRYAEQRLVAELMGPECVDSACAAAVAAVQPFCFSGGLTLDGPVAVHFDSRGFRDLVRVQEEAARLQREHEATRQVQKAFEAAQAEHLDHLSSLLARVSKLAKDSPDVELPELIRTFSERQRGELYEALFASETPGVRTRWIVVAVGEELLFFDPRHPEMPHRRLFVAGEVGPVRSVHAMHHQGRATLWLGASTGVYRLPLERAEPDLTLVVEGARPVRGGFNSVALAGDRLIAAHSELGLFSWTWAGEPPAPTLDPKREGPNRRLARPPARPLFETLTRGAKAVRCLSRFNDHFYCTIDDRAIRWPENLDDDQRPDEFLGSCSTLTALCPSSQGLLAGNSEGDLLCWKGVRDGKPERLLSGSRRAVESIRLLTTHGVTRMIHTDTTMQVHARVLGDSFTCQYEAGGQTLRRVVTASDLLVATTELRDRLVLWSPGRPARPLHNLGVSALCGRSIQDVCLISEA